MKVGDKFVDPALEADRFRFSGAPLADEDVSESE